MPVAFGVAVAVAVRRAGVAAQPFRGWAAFFTRVRDFVPGAFALASVAMVVMLAVRLALRLHYVPAAPRGGADRLRPDDAARGGAAL